jgi:ADP-ribose pyrophosphatase YjhB (NUDIX family)
VAHQYPINFCPVCAARLERREKHGAMRPVCPSCNYVHFCDPKVAAITLIERNGQVLLARRAMNPAKGRWTLPGGFVECEEDPRETAIRECREELGLEVEITRLMDLYYGKAHESGASIVILYAGRLEEGTAPEPGDDVDAVAFFGPKELPELAFASTRQILAEWRGPSNAVGTVSGEIGLRDRGGEPKRDPTV